MIGGVFIDREAKVPLVVHGPTGKEQGVAAIVDTGFSGAASVKVLKMEDGERFTGFRAAQEEFPRRLQPDLGIGQVSSKRHV